LDTKFAQNEYRDLILYKCTVLCGAALLYGILPLYGSEKALCKNCLELINKIMPELYRGGNIKMFRRICVSNWNKIGSILGATF